MLRGEPGVGKSTLVDAFLEGATGQSCALAAAGQCLGHRGPGEPYMPVLEALGALARSTDGEAVVARAGAGRDRRLVGARGRGGATARGSLAGRLPDNEPQVSVLLALATLYELRGEFTRSYAMAQECRRLVPNGAAESELECSELLLAPTAVVS